MKAFTDLKQSRELTEILPLESADMIWILANPDLPMIKAIAYKDSEKNKYYETLPAWSLAALIDILPQFIKFKGDKYYLRFMKEYVEYANDEVSITGRCLHTTGNDNLVDACVEMIKMLHEGKMLSLR